MEAPLIPTVLRHVLKFVLKFEQAILVRVLMPNF